MTLVAPDAAPRLGRAIAPFGLVFHSRSAIEAARTLEGGTASWLVVDPTLLRLDALSDIIETATRAGAGVLAQLTLTDDAVERQLQLLMRHSVEVRFEVRTLGRARSHACLGRPPVVSLPSALLRALGPQLLRLPAQIRTLIVGVLSVAPDEPQRQRLVGAYEVSRRSIDRWLRRASLTSLARTERAARVARSWDFLTHEQMSLGELAGLSGFGAERTLCAAWKATCGLSPRRAALALSAHDVLARLVTSMAAIPLVSQAG